MNVELRNANVFIVFGVITPSDNGRDDGKRSGLLYMTTIKLSVFVSSARGISFVSRGEKVVAHSLNWMFRSIAMRLRDPIGRPYSTPTQTGLYWSAL